MPKLVSIIVPIYNSEKYLPRCVDSILSQTYRRIEVILIDDGSTDRSGKLCDEYNNQDKRIVVKHQKNSGLSAARNAGLDIARGDYVSFVDSDDYVSESFIEALLNPLEKTSGTISICPHYERKEDGSLKNFNHGKKSAILSIEETLERMLNEQGFNLQVTSKLFSRTLFEESSTAQRIRFQKGVLHEDVGVTYRLFLRAYEQDKNATAVYVEEPHYYYNLHSSSIVHTGFDPRKKYLVSATDEMCKEIDSFFPSLKDSTNLRRLHARFSILRQTTQMTHKTEIVKQYEDELISYIKVHQDWILRNRLSTRRDRFALAALHFGKTPFRMSWRIYELLAK